MRLPVSTRSRYFFVHLFKPPTFRDFHGSHNRYLAESASVMVMQYPSPRQDESFEDNYHGKKVKDPYRWMEDPDSEETKKFVDEQNAITRPFLDNCRFRNKINARLTELWNYPKYSCPKQRNDKYTISMNTGLQNQSVLYVLDSLNAEPRVFLDPNALSEDGTISVNSMKFSDDDKILAYGLSSCGSDWVTIQFKHIDEGDIYPEKLEKVKFSSATWTHDNKGVFYACYSGQEGKTDGSENETNKNHKLFYHVLGTPQSEDILAVEFPEEPKYLIGAEISDCGRYLIVCPQKGCKNNLVYISDLDAIDRKITKKLELLPIVTKIEADYEFIANNGTHFVFRTNKEAPNYKLIRINIERPNPDAWETLIPEHREDVLDWAGVYNDNYLIMCYMRDVKNVLVIHDFETGKFLYEFSLDAGTITGFSGRRKYNDIFYSFVSFLTPGLIYQCDLSKTPFQPKLYREIKATNFDRRKFEVEQIFYSSKDGTKVPMYVMHKKGIVKDGNNPCMLYGYGGFNVSLLPTFSVTRLVFMDNFNGVYAVPNLRGGGEYGEKWHKAGREENKQNVFDDFHAAAEYLIANGYTKPSRLAINGGSNGGLLVAACANQRPDLYGAMIANVGVLDMLRYHKFTIGYLWATDYGTSDDENLFKTLIKYSPVHNIRIPDDISVQYPATLLLTADHDDRVSPLHSLKFIATLQETFRGCTKQTNPLIIRIETKAGHGGGKPTSKLIDEVTDTLCFLVETLNFEFYNY